MGDLVGIEPKSGTRVVSIFAFCAGLRGTITRSMGSFAYIKWDDASKGETAEDYDVIVPESIYDEEGLEKELKLQKKGIFSE